MKSAGLAGTEAQDAAAMSTLLPEKAIYGTAQTSDLAGDAACVTNPLFSRRISTRIQETYQNRSSGYALPTLRLKLLECGEIGTVLPRCFFGVPPFR